MLSRLLTLAVVGLAFAEGERPVDVFSGSPRIGSRIIGGAPAQITETPYQVALLLDYWDVGTFTQACGGAIISNSVILSVAQCVNNTRASQWRVRAGSSLHNSGGQVVAVTRYLMHPGANSRLDNDIALLWLAAPLTLGPSASTVVLPVQGQNVTDGSNGTLAGWGTLSDGGTAPTQLYRVTLPVVNQQQCVAAYSTFNPVTSNMLCAGRIGIGGIGACKGDAGGAFVVGGIVVGLTSWARGCGQANYPDVLTRVANYRTWIESNTL